MDDGGDSKTESCAWRTSSCKFFRFLAALIGGS